MAGTERGFLDDANEPEPVALEHNRFVVSLIPYEETTTYRRGTRRAPEAIVDASGHIETFDEMLAIDASTHGILTVRPEVPDLAAVTAHARRVREAHPDALLGFLGGEHSITPAILAGVARETMGILWIDAHADLRPEFHGRPDNHACAGRNSLHFGPMVQIGVRTLAEEEFTFLGETDRVATFPTWNDASRAALLALPDDVYLSFDCDGFSPEVVRAVGTPEPGGLAWHDAMEILSVLFEHKNVFAFDVVELCPQESDVASDFTVARLVYKILSYHAFHRLGGTAR